MVTLLLLLPPTLVPSPCPCLMAGRQGGDGPCVVLDVFLNSRPVSLMFRQPNCYGMAVAALGAHPSSHLRTQGPHYLGTAHPKLELWQLSRYRGTSWAFSTINT